MKRSLLLLVFLSFAHSVFGQDVPQTGTESTLSFLSIHLAPRVNMEIGGYSGDTVHPGPGAAISVKYRLPALTWLFASIGMMYEVNGFSYHAGNTGDMESFGGYGQLGVMFDVGPAFSLGACFGPGYSMTRVRENSDPNAPPESGSGISLLGSVFGWYRIFPSLSLGAEIDGYNAPPSNHTRVSFGLDVGYHFPGLAAPAAQNPAPQPVPPAPERPRQPSWLSLGVGASGGYYSEGETFSAGPNDGAVTLTYVPFNIFGFVDATYVEASVGYMFYNDASLKAEATGFQTETTNFKEKAGWLSIAALFKYPFKLGTFTWFPIAGIEYDMNLTYTDADGNDFKSGMTADEKANLDQLWIKVGVGADFTFGNIFIRPRILAGYKLLSKLERDTISSLKSAGADSADIYPLTISGGLLIGYKL
jgi:hypothetical protein